jgi:hypothetical protein
MKTFLRNLCLALAGTSMAAGADLTSSGDWLESVNASNLIAGAGSDLQPLQSMAGVTILNVGNAPGNWRVKARRSAGQWNGNITVWVRRTSDGSGSGTIGGGTTFVELGATDVDLFSGTLNRGNISLQFKVTGLNRTVPPDTYTSSIIFSVQ